jgi:hypothetical protein
MCIVIKDRSTSYHYLALCLYQLMKAAWEAVGVEVLLCMWDSGDSFLCVHMQPLYKMESTKTSWPYFFISILTWPVQGKYLERHTILFAVFLFRSLPPLPSRQLRQRQ